LLLIHRLANDGPVINVSCFQVVPDEVSEMKMEHLREHILRSYIPKENLKEFEVLWKHDDGIHPSTHQDYIDKFCNTFKVHTSY
jgi:hypothetical protein